MKRLFFMLVLTFSTITFFANEKTEALPDFRNLTDVESINYELTFSQAKKDLFQTLWITSIPLLSSAGIQRTHLGRIEAGKYAVTLETLQAIAEALDMTLDIIHPDLQGFVKIP